MFFISFFRKSFLIYHGNNTPPNTRPETGAVFTLGKSYLADTIGTVRHRQLRPPAPQTAQLQSQTGQQNGSASRGRQTSSSTSSSGAMVTLSPQTAAQRQQQSYFFIKNDPVRKIVCGHKQSGVICESGRLFVWGQNQFGQLGLGSTDICQKPSCVRTMKRLQQRVKEARFGGNGYSLILTEEGKIFYSGKNVYPFNAKVASIMESETLRKCSTSNSEFTPIPVELKEFSECLEKEDEVVVDIATGFCHFISRTSAGNCFGWGHNSHQQLGGVDSLKILTKPDRLGVEERIDLVECGNYCSLMVSATNKLYLSGKFQRISIPVIKELSSIELPAKVLAAQITPNDLVYLLLDDNQVYRSTRVQNIEELEFKRLELLDQLLEADEWVTQIAPADNFTSFLTNKGRLLTTYDDDIPFTPSDHFRELTKFRDFVVANVASGLEHSLVQAFPKKACTPAIEVDFTEAVESIEAAINSAEQNIRNGTPMPVHGSEEFIRQEKRRLRQERIVRELSKDECIQIVTDAPDIRFIDNGIEITTTTLAPSERENADAKDALGEQLMNEKNQRLDPRYAPHREIMRDHLKHQKPPTPNISQLIDYSDDEDGSISSQSTFEDEGDDVTEPYITATAENGKSNGKSDSNNNQDEDRKLSVDSKASTKSNGKMKKFLKDLKAKSMDVSCRNAGTVLNDDNHFSKSDDDIRAREKNSKMCSLM
ncbi:X-linked retinitis pigmentosa GTPase regulator [Toxorhynchites rutilus septentrionalis]|uniref:X-linked retinitis pigmentosa GTPase regulator n=1 Tax=Toxorhynchites rutilus septentrionalis TaxID=329112 RepID=UPI002478ED21|nr:X-linked retinitis pigmentosa GTPase regulator [Toxorhynchites rutilus septentrionalis]